MPKIDEIARAIGRIEGKIDGFCNTIVDHEKRINDNEVKIAENEGKMKMVGALGVFIGGIITTIVTWLIKKY